MEREFPMFANYSVYFTLLTLLGDPCGRANNVGRLAAGLQSS